VKNGTETDIDCGGPTCGGCGDNKVCVAPTDCKSLVCSAANKCAGSYSLAGGTWYLIPPAGLPAGTSRKYLYYRAPYWYQSPTTTLAWSWSSFAALNGTYT
jgi:hypothetical protein